MNKYLEKQFKKIGEHMNDLGYVRVNDDFYINIDDEFKNSTKEARNIIESNLSLCCSSDDISKIYPYINSISREKAVKLNNKNYIRDCDIFMNVLEKNTKTKYKKSTTWENIDNSVRFLKANKLFIKNYSIHEIYYTGDRTRQISTLELEKMLDNEFGKLNYSGVHLTSILDDIVGACKKELAPAPVYFNEYLSGELFTKFY